MCRPKTDGRKINENNIFYHRNIINFPKTQKHLLNFLKQEDTDFSGTRIEKGKRHPKVEQGIF
jgi:hypothetical protein